MSNKIVLFGLACILSISMLAVSIPMALKGEQNMATITTISNGQNGATVRASLNTNFSNLNTEHGNLATLTTTSKTNFVGAINELDAEKVQSIYGQMMDNTATLKTVTLSVSGTYYPITAGLSAGELSGITYGTSDLTIGTTGKYLVTYTATTQIEATANITAAIMKNGTALATGKTIMTCTTGASVYTTFNCSVVLSLTAADVIELSFAKNAGATPIGLYVLYTYVTITKV